MDVPQVIIESPAGERLAALPDQVMLCDSTGRAIGIFIPVVSETGTCADLGLPLSLAKLQELRKSREGKPLEDILSRLGRS